MKIVFFGSGSYTIPIVENLKDNGLVLVVTSEPSGKLTTYLKTNNIPFINSRLKNVDDLEKIKSLKPDLGVLASYGAILPKQIIELFHLGILNIHPSLLPKYKGPSPIQFSILNGDKVSGITVIKLDSQIDHGPIVSQKEVKLPENITLESGSKLLFSEGAELIQEIVQKLSNEQVVEEKPQDIKSESWTQKIEKKDGEISLSNPPQKDELLRKIRALYPWPGVHLTVSLGGKNRFLKLLPFDTVQVEGKKPMSYKDFMNGYGEAAITILKQLQLL